MQVVKKRKEKQKNNSLGLFPHLLVI